MPSLRVAGTKPFDVLLHHSADGDQRNAPGPNPDVGMHGNDNRKDHEKGQDNSHQNLDGKDEKSIKNKLAQAAKEEKEQNEAEDNSRPTDAARENGNEPSRGAKIDEQIEKEEEEELRRKGKLD